MRKGSLLLLLLSLVFLQQGFAQKVKIYGLVTDEKDSVMQGVTVAVKGTTTGTQTDSLGKYELEVEPGTHTVDFSFIGYQTRSFLITMLEVKEKRQDVKMTEEGKQLDIVVVTGAKYQKSLGSEVASMEVVKADMIEQSNSKMDEAMNRVPGVNIMGKSISIRGGSGFADITSNRVLVLLDDMPIISPENGGILWDMLPIEEMEQVEIIKGSSSSLYGSSALDGIINVVTVNPQPQPENKVILSWGLYDQPNNKKWDWWWSTQHLNKKGKLVTTIPPRMFGGGSFVHRKQYGDFGVVISGAYQQNQNYLQNAPYFLARMGGKFRYIPHKHPHLTMGVNVNFWYKSSRDFFAAAGVDSSMYVSATPPPPVTQREFNIDPYFNYYDNHDNRHSFKFRVFNVVYQSAAAGYFSSGDSTNSMQYYLDYSIQHNFRKVDMILTAGVNGFISTVTGKTFANLDSNITNIRYNNTRDVKNIAAYVQFEKRFFKKFTIEGGLRFEYAQLEDTTVQNRLPLINLINSKAGGRKDINSPVTPLARVGFNYQITEGTFLRGSIGQGFRYPALAEKYVYTLRSGAQVFPNDTLKPENGWMTELGIKQGVKVSKWVAYFDLSGFFMRYHDMIEFEHDSHVPSGVAEYGIPFIAQNVDNARISGVEVSALGNGSIFGVPLNFLVGYTYIYPQDLSYPARAGSTPLLKYRTLHNAKADVQFNYKGALLGISGFYTSYMKYIDNAAIGALAVVGEFRKTHDMGEFVMDVRAGYSYHEKFTFMFIAKNVSNTEYMLQPGVVEAPRNYTFQVQYNF